MQLRGHEVITHLLLLRDALHRLQVWIVSGGHHLYRLGGSQFLRARSEVVASGTKLVLIVTAHRRLHCITGGVTLNSLCRAVLARLFEARLHGYLRLARRESWITRHIAAAGVVCRGLGKLLAVAFRRWAGKRASRKGLWNLRAGHERVLHDLIEGWSFGRIQHKDLRNERLGVLGNGDVIRERILSGSNLFVGGFDFRRLEGRLANELSVAA